VLKKKLIKETHSSLRLQQKEWDGLVCAHVNRNKIKKQKEQTEEK
jgi:predicted RNase H-like nuclease